MVFKPQFAAHFRFQRFSYRYFLFMKYLCRRRTNALGAQVAGVRMIPLRIWDYPVR